MAESTQFGHDQLGHILADHLLEVPKFQRSYSWDAQNVEEFLADLQAARRRSSSYFMGTVVFALPESSSARRTIVDGQQRLATTAILLIAARDLLKTYGKSRQADQLDHRYLRGYDLQSEGDVERLILSPRDQTTYSALLESRVSDIDERDLIKVCYSRCIEALRVIAPTAAAYKNLMDLVKQLETQVQVLVAVASDMPEAYVIFETLNDRGADLTTADLLKNFLFSKAGSHWRFVEERWTVLESQFEKPEDLVKFIRYDYASRNGFVHTRSLYRAVQEEVKSVAGAKKYITSLTDSQVTYEALRDASSPIWNTGVADSVQDAVLAYRRLGFESSFPVLMAAFSKWDKPKATKLFIKLSKWSVRGQIAGRIGARLSEDTFGDTARAISQGRAKNQTDVRTLISKLIPSDTEFESAFVGYGSLSVARAKYLLAMLERAYEQTHSLVPKPFEWHSPGVTIEHIMAESHVGNNEERLLLLNTIGNLSLLEKRLNRDAGGRQFSDKKGVYSRSDFELTKQLAANDTWDPDLIRHRTTELAGLAVLAWPST